MGRLSADQFDQLIAAVGSNPTVNDDSTQGYNIGDEWLNTTTGRTFKLMDATVAAAVWKRETNRKLNEVAIVNPDATDDDIAGYEVGSMWVNTATNELFVAISVSTGAAIWKNTTAVGGNAVNPGELMYGTLLDYPAAGGLSQSTIQLIRVKISAGITIAEMRTFIDSGGAGSRAIRLGIYGQTDPSDPDAEPLTRLAQTNSTTTAGTNGTFVDLAFDSGPLVITITGFYWLALITDATSIKFAVTAAHRADFLPKRRMTSINTDLPVTLTGLTNPVELAAYVAALES